MQPKDYKVPQGLQSADRNYKVQTGITKCKHGLHIATRIQSAHKDYKVQIGIIKCKQELQSASRDYEVQPKDYKVQAEFTMLGIIKCRRR